MEEIVATKLKACSLDILVPENTSYDFRTLFRSDSSEHGSEQKTVGKLETLEHRTVLYFGQF